MWRTQAEEALISPNARTAAWAIEQKLATLRTVSDDRLPHHVAAAIAECCWWLVSLNDLVERELTKLDKEDYRRDRNDDPSGTCVVGAIWARNRHSHQLIVDIHSGDERPFLPRGADYVFFISRELKWKRVDDMALRPHELDLGRWAQSAYESHFQDRGVLAPLEAAASWFRTIAVAEPA